MAELPWLDSYSGQTTEELLALRRRRGRGGRARARRKGSRDDREMHCGAERSELEREMDVDGGRHRALAERLDRIVQALEETPGDVRLQQRAGELCQMLGDDRRAASYFDAVADFYARDGFFLKAVALSKQVQRLDAEILSARRRLLSSYVKLGLQGEAREAALDLRARTENPEELEWIDEMLANLEEHD